ncbi:MAG TPA: hypothetical protein VGX03_05120 [Candidatus Binatia bacterium]|jgi:hypothetical protein|nr:hypothetical protein [Candidatus Binatia bacterium]
MRSIALALIVAIIFPFPAHVYAQTAPRSSRTPDAAQQLRRELDAMKQQMQQMQDKILKQEEVIQKLSSQAAPPPVAAPVTPAAGEEQFKREVKEEILRDIRPSLAAANKTFPSQFNPAIGLVMDNVFSSKEKERANFEFRSAEVGISANIDPFTRGYAILNGTPDGFEVEEAAIVTTALPYNLTVKGGRFFADFGRLSKFHDHNLPFVNRPVVLDRFVEGESQADGVEVSYLAPLRQYVTLTAGMYNKLGGENERVDNLVPRNFSEFTYLGRAATFFNFTDASSADLGLSYAYTPKIKIEERANRHLAGVDLTFRYLPLSQAGYRGLIWGTELLYNHENRPVGGFPEEENTGDVEEPLQFKRRNAFGLYSYVEARLTRRFYLGFLVDWAQSIDPGIKSTIDYSPYLTIWASEFQRIRLQYTRFEGPGNHENQFFAQWSIALGSHVHGFIDR